MIGPLICAENSACRSTTFLDTGSDLSFLVTVERGPLVQLLVRRIQTAWTSSEGDGLEAQVMFNEAILDQILSQRGLNGSN